MMVAMLKTCKHGMSALSWDASLQEAAQHVGEARTRTHPHAHLLSSE